MRKRCLFISVLILHFCCGYTQLKNKNYLDFTIGPSFPVGEYGQKDIKNNSSGFANTGEFLKISYVHQLLAVLSISLPVKFNYWHK
jgi:hypothetical protein